MVHSSATAAALLGITALVGVVAGNRCFVCVPRTETWKNEAMKQFPGQTELPLCEHFNPKDMRYERECPSGYNGCLTRTNEPHVLRMCSAHGGVINDCKVANGIHYCFCSGKDLCNDNTQFPTRTTDRPMSRPTTDYDEEETTEGSGDYSPPTKTTYSPTTARPPHGTTTNDSPSRGSATICRTLGLLPVMAALVTATAH